VFYDKVIQFEANAPNPCSKWGGVFTLEEVPKVMSAPPLPVTQLAPAGENYVDQCFLCDWSELDDPRDWRSDPRLTSVLDLVYDGHHLDALQKLEEVWEEFFDYDFVYYWKAIILARRGEPGEAMATLREGLSKARTKFYLCQKWADLQYEAGHLPDAVVWWIRSAVSQIALKGPVASQPFLYLAYIAGFLGDGDAKQKLLAVVDRLTAANRLNYETQVRIKSLVAAQGDRPMHSAIYRLCRAFL
jgi:hypothetical protein